MINLYEKINDLWPVRRKPEEKQKERDLLQDFPEDRSQEFINHIEILLDDYSNKYDRLPSFLSVIEKFLNKKQVYIPQQVPDSAVVSTQVYIPNANTEQEKLFDKLFKEWPQGEVPFNRNTALEGYRHACTKYSLADIERAAMCYKEYMSDSSTSALHVMGMKKFFSDEDLFSEWLHKASPNESGCAKNAFEAVWAIYPLFTYKNAPKTKLDAFTFFKRFVTEERQIDFWCAVNAYAHDRRWELREIEESGQQQTDDEQQRYTKTFVNFIRYYEDIKCYDELFSLLELPLLFTLRAHNVPVELVYPDEMYQSALKYCTREVWNNKIKNGAVYCVTKMLELISQYIKKDEGLDMPPNYDIVGEVLAEVKKKIYQVPVVVQSVCD
jgi:hypothetical protein